MFGYALFVFIFMVNYALIESGSSEKNKKAHIIKKENKRME